MQLEDLFSDLLTILTLTAWPLLLTLAAGLSGLIYRWLTWWDYSRAPHLRSDQQGRPGRRLSARKAADVPAAPEGSGAAAAVDDAARVNARVHRAHIAAWAVYTVIICSLMVTFVDPKLALTVRVGVGWAYALPQLLILFWAIGLPAHRAAALFAVYALVGVALFCIFIRWQYVGMVSLELMRIAIIPIPGVLILFYRRNQPFLIFWIAAVLYFLATGAMFDRVLHGVTMGKIVELSGAGWAVALGLGNEVIGFAGAWLLLRQRRRSLLVIAIAAGVVAAVLIERDIAHATLPTAVAAACVLAFAVLQPLVLWSLFEVFVGLGDRRFLTPELVQIHLCWAFLTFYFVGTTLQRNPLYRDRLAVRWGVIAALLLFIAVLHALLVRVYLQRPPTAKKRLLLLRVFGRPHEREDLLDDLDDTWRRVGDVVLFAASDVAARTLESRMLETFLLRPNDDQFLRTEREVDARIQQLRSAIEGDARYPVNPFFCHERIWWTAFTRLVDLSDVILMDLRGFTTANEGCVRELGHLLRHPLKRAVFIADDHTDLMAIEESADEAGVTDELTILEFGRRSRDERRALFDLLLGAAYG